MYAHVVGGVIDAEQDVLPGSALRLDTGQWVSGLPAADVETQHACGWFVVTENPRPPDTATHTSDRVLIVDGSGKPVETWVVRPKTQAELDADTFNKNKTTNEQHLEEDLAKMQATIDATNATINSNPAPWIKDIARAMRRNIKHALNDFQTGAD